MISFLNACNNANQRPRWQYKSTLYGNEADQWANFSIPVCKLLDFASLNGLHDHIVPVQATFTIEPSLLSSIKRRTQETSTTRSIASRILTGEKKVRETKISLRTWEAQYTAHVNKHSVPIRLLFILLNLIWYRYKGTRPVRIRYYENCELFRLLDLYKKSQTHPASVPIKNRQ